jgi:hypothetical protein
VLAEDTLWQGEVLIDGVVTVKKQARLTIAAGTRVRFVPRDIDGDGIGDAELLVEGELVARGTAAEPIVLTSAARQPAPADWKYLYVNFARGADIDHLVSEYAYSGIQVHFSRARVTNSVLRHNIDGLRFSTVNLLAAGNRIYANRNGLRYEERNSKVELYHNDIRDNEIGLFVVTRSDDLARIVQNNITGNRSYNVKLGLQQAGDVSLPENWWGTTDPQEISAGFFDRSADASLGRVTAPRPLRGPVDIERWQAAE